MIPALCLNCTLREGAAGKQTDCILSDCFVFRGVELWVLLCTHQCVTPISHRKAQIWVNVASLLQYWNTVFRSHWLSFLEDTFTPEIGESEFVQQTHLKTSSCWTELLMRHKEAVFSKRASVHKQCTDTCAYLHNIFVIKQQPGCWGKHLVAPRLSFFLLTAFFFSGVHRISGKRIIY